MVSSMTGFGRSDITHGHYRITVELKSVNNRFLDLNIKMPRRLGALEADIRAHLKTYMKRGKTDVYISLIDDQGADARVRYNRAIAAEYLTAIQAMSEEFAMENDIRLSALARFPDVFVTEEEALNEEEILEGLLLAVDQACGQFCAAREREGAFLCRDLTDKLNEMREDVDYIEKRSPEIIENYKRSLREKVRDLMADSQLEESRIMTEITLYADKICVDEELVRLRSHIDAMQKLLDRGDDKEGIGRQLDFLAQEMNREANTILSKSTDLSVSDRGINLKTAIEKVREQIQNIE